MRVREACRGDHELSRLRLDSDPLVQELRFPAQVDVVQIEKPKQDALERPNSVRGRENFGMPVRIAAFPYVVLLNVDDAEPVVSPEQILRQRVIPSHFREFDRHRLGAPRNEDAGSERSNQQRRKRWT
jgi:hypothetical protein